MSVPKVILIGGCPGAGKTTLGRALAAKLDYASLTIDDLLGAARAITTEDSHPGLHVMNKPNYREYFTDSSVERLVADANAQHEAMWPAVERTIRSHATWGTPIVIDGWHMRPSWTKTLGLSDVCPSWLIASEEVIEGREGANPFFDDSANPAQMRQRFVGRSLWFNTLAESEAQAVGDRIIRQDGSRSVDDLVQEALSRF